MTSEIQRLQASPIGAGADLLNIRRDAQGNASAKEIAGAFEQIFLQQLLREMSSSLEGGFFGEEQGTHVYQGLFENLMARKMAEGGGLGLAPVVEKGIERQLQLAKTQVVSMEKTP